MKIIFLCLVVIMAFTSCKSNEKYIDNNIAEIRECLYEGKVDNVSVSLICGKRESDYVLNGYATSLIEFGVLTFDVEGLEENNSSSMKYVLTVGTTRYEGDLQINPFDETFVADIKKSINTLSGVSAKIMLGEYVKEVKLTRVDSDWEVDANRVKEIIAKKFKNEIDSIVEDGIFKGEVYIKILNDADMYIGDYYWYVSVISRSGGKLNAIISHKTGEVLSSNNTLMVLKKH